MPKWFLIFTLFSHTISKCIWQRNILFWVLLTIFFSNIFLICNHNNTTRVGDNTGWVFVEVNIRIDMFSRKFFYVCTPCYFCEMVDLQISRLLWSPSALFTGQFSADFELFSAFIKEIEFVCSYIFSIYFLDVLLSAYVLWKKMRWHFLQKPIFKIFKFSLKKYTFYLSINFQETD